MLVRFLSALYMRARGRPLVLGDGISVGDVFVATLRKGLLPYIRGKIVALFVRDSRGAMYVGRAVSLYGLDRLTQGAGFRIGDRCHLDFLSSDGVVVGDRVTFREGVWLQITSRYDNPGVGVRIGDDVYVGPYCILGAAALLTIGDRCQFGAHVSLIAENHEFEGRGSIHSQGVRRKGITIGSDCWFGNNAIVLDGVVVGDGCVVGAGAVVTKDVPPYSVVVGNPARVVKGRE